MALLASSLINILFQLITYFFPHITFNYISPFFYEKYLHFFEYQFNRNRFFGDSFDEIMIPLIILYLIQEKKFINKLFYILFTILIIFVTLISNWRTKAVIFIFVFLHPYIN